MDEQVKYTEDFERGRLFGREQILEIMDLQGFGGRKVVIEMDKLRKEVSESEARVQAASVEMRQQNAALVEALRETLACLLHFDPCTPRTRKAISNAKDALAPYAPADAPEKEP